MCSLTFARARDSCAQDIYRTLEPTNSHVKVISSLSTTCTLSVPGKYGNSFISYEGMWYRHDPRLQTVANTVADPSSSISSVLSHSRSECINVKKTFLNAHTCTRRTTCAAPEYSSLTITLNHSTLRTFYQAARQPVLAVRGLRLEGRYRVSPCSTSKSRWKRIGNANATIGVNASDGDSANITHPSQCAAGRCCGVLFKGAAAAHCRPVPIWDFTSWTHPGPGSVTRQRLCGQVRYSWLDRSSSHTGFNPEDATATTLAYGAFKVGEHVDASCLPPAPPPPPPACANTLDNFTVATIRSKIRASNDPNPALKDITMGSNSVSSVCVVPIGTVYEGVKVEVDGECWQHVHPHEWDVRDVYRFMLDHPGNTAAFTPIVRFAERGETFLTFPTSHDMDLKWASRQSWMPKLGRLGDDVDFSRLGDTVRVVAAAEAFGAVVTESGESSEACGSPGEVANEPSLDHRYHGYINSIDYGNEALYRHYSRNNGKTMVHATLTLTAPDQLRQRMAWALSQIYVIGVDGLSRAEEQEIWHTYYDIFVRHAFGNLRDVLREVSYSPAMGIYLTYHGSYSIAYSGTVPDENYARELMQLFTIGLWELDADGTPKLDASGNQIQTYDSEEIQSFAKAWTGFYRQGDRGNTERRTNYFDPMRIYPDRRDMFPKMDLYHGHLGDTYPLCSALLPRSFLRPGAKYRYLGRGSRSELQYDQSGYSRYDNRWWSQMARFTPERNRSALHHKLCWPEANVALNLAADAHTMCNYSSEVILDEVLPCDGIECNMNASKPRTVGIKDADDTYHYYEYVPPPCTHLAFFEGGRFGQFHYQAVPLSSSAIKLVCLEPNATLASTSCCVNPDQRGSASCGYLGERVDYATAEARCDSYPSSTPHSLCPMIRRAYMRGGRNTLNFSHTTSDNCGLNHEYTWMDMGCSTQAQVDVEGKIHLVHASGVAFDGWLNVAPYIEQSVRPNARSNFRVRWRDGDFPTAATNCSLPSGAPSDCNITGTTCLCPTEATTSVVFVDHAAPPNRSTILSTLHIGSVSADVHGAGAYVLCTSPACTAVSDDGALSIYTHTSSNGHLDEHTIFRVAVNNSRVLHLSNLESSVRVAGRTFRNPPSFMKLSDPSERDAQYETEALIDQVFYHANTPPFISTRLIQRFTTSNPSPRYVTTVANAFINGAYGGTNFSGQYGDLGAALTAILLDAEGSSSTLDADASHGGLREPILKLYHLMRAMEFTREDGRELEFYSLHEKIGQFAYHSPTVFSFYLPDYKPPGAVTDSELVSPEGQVRCETLWQLSVR